MSRFVSGCKPGRGGSVKGVKNCLHPRAAPVFCDTANARLFWAVAGPGGNGMACAKGGKDTPVLSIHRVHWRQRAMMTTTPIRPGLDALRGRPTLQRVADCCGTLELKLETADTRYWVTTR